MRKTLLVIAVMILCSFIGCTTDNSSKEEVKPPDTKGLNLSSEFEGGWLFKADGLFVVQLNGNYREMGRQYGWLMESQISKMYDDSVNNYILTSNKANYEDIEKISKEKFNLYPQRFKEFIYGMNQTSTLGLEKLIILNNMEVVAHENPGCSTMVVWDEYTKDETLVFGRNFDSPEYFEDFSDCLTVVVLNPDDGSRSTALLTYAGQIVSFQGFNDAGIVLGINDDNDPGISKGPDDRTPFFILGVQFMLDFGELKGVDAAIKTSRSSSNLIVNVADKKVAYSYEATTADWIRRSGEEKGLLVATNHFVDPWWNVPAPGSQEDITKSVQRRKNLIEQADDHKGNIDAEIMMKILDVQLDDGGATLEDTIYQFVVVPKSKKLWVNIPGHQEWTEIDLSGLFEKPKNGKKAGQ